MFQDASFSSSPSCIVAVFVHSGGIWTDPSGLDKHSSILNKQAPIKQVLGSFLPSYREFSKCTACGPDLSGAPETIKAYGDHAHSLSGQERPPPPPYFLAAKTEPPHPSGPRIPVRKVVLEALWNLSPTLAGTSTVSKGRNSPLLGFLLCAFQNCGTPHSGSQFRTSVHSIMAKGHERTNKWRQWKLPRMPLFRTHRKTSRLGKSLFGDIIWVNLPHL